MACTAEAGLARSTVSFGRERSRQLTGFGQETRAIPPSDGPAIKCSEDGGGRWAASGRKRGRPRLRQLLMHLREKKAPEQIAVVSRVPLRETNHLAARARDWEVCWPQARYSWLPGQAWLSTGDKHPRGAAPSNLHPQRMIAHPPMLRSTSDPPGVHWIKCWQPREADQRNHLGAEQDDRAIRGPWGLVRWRSSYCNHQFSQSASRRFSARAREVLVLSPKWIWWKYSVLQWSY